MSRLKLQLWKYNNFTTVYHSRKHLNVFCCSRISLINTLRPRQDSRHFTDDIFKCIFLNWNRWISIDITLTFAPRGPINNIPALVQIMAWRRPSDKPLSEPMTVRLPTHICVTRSQWVNNDSITCCILITNDYYIFTEEFSIRTLTCVNFINDILYVI